MADLSFRSTLKPLEVEEVIDVLVHRPLAYGITRAVYPTPVTPDQLTWLSMVLGVAAGVLAWCSFFTGHPRMVLAGGLFIASAVIDCADGQLARMRQTSSAWGRMLDGAVDSIVQIAVVPAVVAHIWWRHGGWSPGPWPPGVASHPAVAVAWLTVCVAAVVTGLSHTTLYDHFKNVYLHCTQVRRKEGDDPEEIEVAYADSLARGQGPSDWLRFFVYRNYLRNQASLLRRVDPCVPSRFRAMPVYTPDGAERYRALNRGPMRVWTFYGIGTHIFGLGVAMALDRIEVYILVRLLVFNGLLFWLIPAQRRASRAFFGDPS